MSVPALTGVTVRPARTGDLDAIVDVLGATYGGVMDATTARRFYAWKYFDLAGRDTGHPSAFVAADADGVVGVLGALPFVLRHGATHTPAGWVADWHLRPRGRGRGVGTALLRAALDAVPAMACVDGSADAERVFRAEGFVPYDCGDLWLRVRRPLAYEWPTRRGLRRSLALYRAAGHQAARLAARLAARPPADLVLEPWPANATVLPAGEPVDGLLRDDGYLAWLARCPIARAERCALRERQATVGHVLLHVAFDRLGRRRGRIVDLLAAGGDPTAAYRCAAAVLEQRGVAFVELVAPAAHGAALRAAGFRRRAGRRLWLRAPFPAPPPSHPWHISLADKDDAFRGAPGIP